MQGPTLYRPNYHQDVSGNTREYTQYQSDKKRERNVSMKLNVRQQHPRSYSAMVLLYTPKGMTPRSKFVTVAYVPPSSFSYNHPHTENPPLPRLPRTLIVFYIIHLFPFYASMPPHRPLSKSSNISKATTAKREPAAILIKTTCFIFYYFFLSFFSVISLAYFGLCFFALEAKTRGRRALDEKCIVMDMDRGRAIVVFSSVYHYAAIALLALTPIEPNNHLSN